MNTQSRATSRPAAGVKVLLTLDSLYNGGTETSLLDMARRFTTVEPVFCCFYQHRHLERAFEEAGIRVHFLGMDAPYGFARAAAFLRRVLELERPHLVVGHLLRAELVTRWVCRSAGLPVVGTFVNDTYGVEAYAGKSATWKLKTEFFKRLNAMSARACDHFIANSRSIGESNAAALGIPVHKISVVPRGRDETVFRPDDSPRVGAGRTILNVARLLERKGQRELVRAFARIAPDYPDLKLQIAGDGVFRGVLEHEIAACGLTDRVTLLGNVRDVPDRLRQADLFVLPSHFEGFSGALVEAMLTGMPIVASGIPMNLEAVDREVTARVFPVRDIDALEREIRWCLEHPEAAIEMGRRARHSAVERFALSRVAEDYERLLLDLIGRQSGASA